MDFEAWTSIDVTRGGTVPFEQPRILTSCRGFISSGSKLTLRDNND